MIKSDDSRAALGDAQFSTKRVEPRAASPKGAAAGAMNALKVGGAKGSAANRSGSQRAGGAASTTKNRSTSGRRNPAAQPAAQQTRGVATKKGPVAKGKKGPGPMGSKGPAAFS